MGKMDCLLDKSWLHILKNEMDKEYFVALKEKVFSEYEKSLVFPQKEDLFRAFSYATLTQVKVVILGQDPYHNLGQAHGLSFSVKPEVDIPPSLKNIYKELQDDLGCYIPNHGYLEKWAEQGVLLLNTVLTVRAHEANSHRGIGWEQFTDHIIFLLSNEDRPIVFILWGGPAQKKEMMLKNPKHLVLKAPHPSPLSSYRGFFGSKPFSQTNNFLEKNNMKKIDWQIENIENE